MPSFELSRNQQGYPIMTVAMPYEIVGALLSDLPGRFEDCLEMEAALTEILAGQEDEYFTGGNVYSLNIEQGWARIYFQHSDDYECEIAVAELQPLVQAYLNFVTVPVLEALRQADPRFDNTTPHELARADQPEAIAPLAALLLHPWPYVRDIARFVLTKYGPAAIPAVQAVLERSDSTTRWWPE